MGMERMPEAQVWEQFAVVFDEMIRLLHMMSLDDRVRALGGLHRAFGPHCGSDVGSRCKCTNDK